MSESFIGASLVVDGEISSEDSLVIEGTVKGKVSVRGDVQVADAAVLDADIEAAALTIAGQVKGKVAASERLEIKSHGRLIGNVKTPKILIAEGATFKGSVDMDV